MAAPPVARPGFGQREVLVKKQQIVAVLLLLALCAWLFIPRPAESVDEDELAREAAVTPIVALAEDAPAGDATDVAFVRANRILPQVYTSTVRVRGRTEAYRLVEVRAEQAGRIVNNPIPRGARVSEGDVLCEIAVDTRQTDLEEAVARREQAEFEYEAALDLQRRDLQSDVAVAQYRAALESARAAVARAELALEKIRIVAPFDGIVETRTVEIGDLLNVGTVCASVLDDDPMLLVGLVPEQDVGRIEIGAEVSAELVSGETITGRVIYLARSADPSARSYRIEVEVDPGQLAIRSGITTEMQVGASRISAHLIPPSALTLDDAGLLGVKTIDRRNIVEFRNVEIVGDNTSLLNPGVWVTGLDGEVNLITVGQEIVFPGQTVTTELARPE
ncbi:MAG: efflux RND transporter periplasmic adaptor subunit [Gammaproteobacteria bacterium]|nr:efflux RND transporter periplasmic adaptor subunit [Gammaproteobacteria bacterium]MYH84744.1 efflux RND transporter periplasmic adaptor subunit [Gammaproteobacteria bacterium]MYK04462.1 efflux RND transporter periplasmic adaptor subunit [Gammaproteobacteria bacterium]